MGEKNCLSHGHKDEPVLNNFLLSQLFCGSIGNSCF